MIWATTKDADTNEIKEIIRQGQTIIKRLNDDKKH